ncbi:hypothetical protein RUND412_009672 [Rhizina undulata]
MTTHDGAAKPTILSGDRSKAVSVKSVTSDHTIDAVGDTPNMSPQAAVAGPDNVKPACTAPGAEAQEGVHAVAKPTVRGILEPAGRVLEAKI